MTFSLLRIIYSIVIGGEGDGERERERERESVVLSLEKLCHAAMFAQMEKCRALCGRATKRRRRGERCHYVKFGITGGFPAQIGVKVRRRERRARDTFWVWDLDNFSHTKADSENLEFWSKRLVLS